MQLPSWWLLAWLAVVLIGRVRAQCPSQMPSACECQANETVRWTCTGDFDQSKVAFHAAQNQVDKLVLRDCKQPMLSLGVFHPLGVRSLEISSCGTMHVHMHAFDLQADRLEELVLQNNSITEVPSLQKLTKLMQLNLNGNKISTIPEKAFLMTQLQGLRLERNNICEIPLNALVETARTLELLDLSDNCLSAVPATNLRPLRGLMYLDLAANQIADLPPLTFHAFPQLVEVRLTKNMLTRIPANAFSSLPKLEELAMRENRLSVIEESAFQGMPGLKKLDLGHNELAKVPSLGKLEHLKSLRLDSNRIDRVESGAFGNHPSLEVLNLADNQIATVAPGSFSGLKQLVYLLLNNNAIKTIDSNTLKDLSALDRIKLRNNSIVDVDKTAFASSPLLRVIDLAQNRLQRVKAETFAKSVNLTWLDLSRNEISMLDEGSLSNEKAPQLKFLFLNNNPLNCDAKFDWFFTYITTQNLQLRTSTKASEEATCAAPEKYANLALHTVVLRKADERLTESMQALGISKDGGGNPLLKQAQHNSWLNTFLPALTGNPSSVGNTQSLAFLNSLLKSVPNEWRTQLQEIPGMGLLRTGTDNILPDGDRALEEVIGQFSEPLVKAAKGFDMTQDDLTKLLKSIPEIVKKMPKDSSLGSLEDAFVQTVFDGKGVGDPAKQRQLNSLAQRYAQQLSAAAAKSMGMPFNETLLSDSVNATRMANKLKTLPVTFIDGVLKGTPIPFLTAEETQIVKDYLSKSVVPAPSSLNVTDLLGSPEMMKLAKLLPPGTNLTQIPSSVLEDIKLALRTGKLPSIESVLSLPPDIVESLRRKVEELSAVPEEDFALPDNFDLPPLEEHERVLTTPPYDINSIDSELVIKDKDKSKRTWIIGGSIAAALTVLGIGTAVYLVWHYKHSYKVSDTVEMQRANTSNQTRTSSTVPAGFRPKFTSTLRGDGPLMTSDPSGGHSDVTHP